MPFHRPCTVGQRESSENGCFVSLDAACKGEELPNRGGPYVFEPAIESLTAVVTHKVQEAPSQLSCLCQRAIHLRDPIQLHLDLWAQRPWTGQHPPNDLSWGHVFEGRARD